MGRKNKGVTYLALTVFALSAVFFWKIGTSLALENIWIDERELGELCIAQVAPNAGNNRQISPAEDMERSEITEEEEAVEENIEEAAEEVSKETEENRDDSKEEQLKVSSDPLVIIYHTHSSESYMPYKESNYHRAEEEGTVREVGNVLEKELENKGISVIHDKTVHDRPSYNDSYTRSLETIQSLVSKYPTAVYVIDLHRDAAAVSAEKGRYIEIDGKRVATFSMVVGMANENSTELYAFADKVSKKAGSMYDGFGGYIIEKDYNYNEFVSNRALLLEVGNNKNTIEEARLCGEYFAHVLAEVIKEEQ